MGFLNTIIILVFSVAGTILIGSMAAYRDRPVPVPVQEAGHRLLPGGHPGAQRDHAGRHVPGRQRPSDCTTPAGAVLLYPGTDILAIYIFLQFICAASPWRWTSRPDSTGPLARGLLADHPAADQARDRHRRHHQGHHDLQRLLHPVPLHARETSGPSRRRSSGSRDRSAHTGRPSAAGVILVIIPTLIVFLPAALHVQRFHLGRDQVAAREYEKSANLAR